MLPLNAIPNSELTSIKIHSFLKIVLFSLWKKGTSADVSLERFCKSTLFLQTEDRANTVLKNEWTLGEDINEIYRYFVDLNDFREFGGICRI